MKVQHIITFRDEKRALTLTLDNRPVTLTGDDENYDAAVALIKQGASEAEFKELLFAKAAALEKVFGADSDFTLDGGLARYKDTVLPASLSVRLIDMAREGFDLAPMKRFVDNLLENPSNKVLLRLFEFLEFGKMALTDDGCFVAYKKVQGNYRDIHSGRFDNSVGQVLRIPRNAVDDNMEATCSHGLHVCSFDYLSHFGSSSGDHVMVCKVNPKDVVAIPPDYNNTKMRVCAYEVIGEVDDYFKAGDNILAASSVHTDSLLPYRVEVEYQEGTGPQQGSDLVVMEYARLSDAAAEFERLKKEQSEDNSAEFDEDIVSVKLLNAETGTLLEDFYP